MFIYESDQTKETPITQIYREPFTVQYGFSRSQESQMEEDKGQDFLVFNHHAQTLSFVLCDGVSLSFCGDLAAKFLAERLIDWLKETSMEQLLENKWSHDSLGDFLNEVKSEGTDVIKKHKLMNDLPPIVKEVLEEKRLHGSETMFICGKIEMDSLLSRNVRIFLAWAGDSRIRLFDKQNEKKLADFEMNTNERWSTSKGLIGEKLHTFSSSSILLDRLVLYSDGFASLDSYSSIPEMTKLEELRKDSLKSPTSDDLSFLDITW